jgi:hypothetical protein
MSKAAHTPGPWHTSVTHLGAAVDIGAANGANIALVSGPAENGADEFKANARLIAAAPDMLEALRDCAESLSFARDKLGMCGEGDGQDRKADAPDSIGSLPTLIAARAAIAKAGAA